jgi:HTH-type transcriptional regulator/antitoxin HipB
MHALMYANAFISESIAIAYMDGISLRTPAAIGALIKDRRRKLGLDQADLAAQIGVSRLWVNQVERGKPGASLGLVLRALGALGVELRGTSYEEADGKPQSAVAPIVTPDIDAVIAAARSKRGS